MNNASQGVFTWENSHQREFHTGMTFWFRIAFTWWLGHSISCYLTVHFMFIKYTFGSKTQTLRMRYSFQSTGRPISHRNGWSFRVYMIPLRDFVPEWNSRPGARTGMNSHRGDSRRHNILWWYHVNKYRAMRGNRSELAPGRKSPRCHVNTSLDSLIIHQVKTKKIITVKEVWIPGLNWPRFWKFYFSIYSLVFVPIEKVYQTLEAVFHRLSKHLEFRIFNSFLGVWTDERQSLVFDASHTGNAWVGMRSRKSVATRKTCVNKISQKKPVVVVSHFSDHKAVEVWHV